MAWHRQRRNTKPLGDDPTPEEERKRLQEEWDALSDQREALDRLETELASRTPGDVPRPSRPGIPIELPPKIVWGAIVGFLTVSVTVIGSAFAMYYKAGVHIDDAKVHVMEADGIPTMVRRKYETAEEAKNIRVRFIGEIENKMKAQHADLADDLVKAIAPPAKYRAWKRKQNADGS